MSESLPSSPDPLGILDENTNKLSPLKPQRSTVTPRKPLRDATGNAPLQEFYLTTPRVGSSSSSPVKGSKQENDSESPWRIRLTVQAERVDEAKAAVSPKRVTEHRITTTVPLRGGDDDSPVIKKGRGRPRKSLNSPIKRNGTPKPTTSRRRQTVPETGTVQSDGSWAPTPPNKGRTRGRNSVQSEHDLSYSTSNPTATPTRFTPERMVSARPFSRLKNKHRRKEITPMKISNQTEPESGASPAETPSGIEPRSASIDNAISDPKEAHIISIDHADDKKQDDEMNASKQSIQSLERSTLDIEDERMWRSMIRKGSVSPALEMSYGQHDSLGPNPTEEHQEFDTILESEGFSMVSVESLQSTSSRSENKAEGCDHSSIPSTTVAVPSYEPPAESKPKTEKSILSKQGTLGNSDLLVTKPIVQSSRNHLPSSLSIDQTPPAGVGTPLVPPAPQCAALRVSGRQLGEASEGTPKLERVVRAAAALQSIPSPPSPERDAVSQANTTLASPFSAGKEQSIVSEVRDTSLNESNQSSRSQEQTPGLFNGFSAGTRRELRAGLRLGEELAKRQRSSLPSFKEERKIDLPIVQSQSSPVYPPLPGTDHHVDSGQLNLASAQSATSQLRYPLLSNGQLPSPGTTSEIEEGESRMSWKGNTPLEPELVRQATVQSTSAHTPTREASSIDHTMLAKEAEWQREREAVSKQIREANTSQIIVINSDDEDFHLGESDEIDEDDSPPEDAKRSGKSSLPSPVLSDLLVRQEVIVPRRSKIPSPWRRNSQAENDTEVEPSESDLFWQPNHAQAEAAKKRQQRKKQREASETSSTLSAVSSIQIKGVPCDTEDLQTPISNLSSQSLHPAVKHHQINSPQTPVYEDDSQVSESEENVYDHSQSSDDEVVADSLVDDTTISLAIDESAASVPLPQSPNLSAIDPELLGARNKSQPQPAARPQNAMHEAPAPSSWFSTLTAPLTSLFTTSAPTPVFPYPPATVSDILTASEYEPLSLYLPWTEAHLCALEPLVNASIFYTPHIFPYNPRSHSAYLLGATVTTARGWARKFTKADCGVLDAFLVVLRHRLDPSDRRRETKNFIRTGDIAKQVVTIWVLMVMRGEVKVGDWKGVKVGLRMSRDRKWREEDVQWKYNRSIYFEEKRREFEMDGLPSWKEKGLDGPFKLD